MPLFTCPNCQNKVRVREQQLGKVLRCPKCGGRFLVDPGLPPDAFVQNYSGEPPPVQDRPTEPPSPSPPSDPWEEIGAESPRPRRRRSWEYEPNAGGDAAGWTWFAVLLLLEVAAGVLWAEIRRRIFLEIYSVLYLGRPIDDSIQSLLFALRFVVLIHESLMICAMFWAAAHARRNGTSIAPWLLPIIFLQSIGLGIYLVGRPRSGPGYSG